MYSPVRLPQNQTCPNAPRRKHPTKRRTVKGVAQLNFFAPPKPLALPEPLAPPEPLALPAPLAPPKPSAPPVGFTSYTGFTGYTPNGNTNPQTQR